MISRNKTLVLVIFHLQVVFTFTSCTSADHESSETAPPTPSQVISIADFPSSFVDARNLEIYLPTGYDSTKAYSVCYMQDGQNLFDPAKTFNNMEWGVDEALDTLGYDLIVVGIWNTPLRYQEYMPQKPTDRVEDELHIAWVIDSNRFKASKPELLSDNYLRFIVEELKPWVDAHYATLPDRDHTFIAGSSMGGLISCYALGEYPGVFSAAGCLSTHLPALQGVFLDYLSTGKPSPSLGSRLWMDHGTDGLDSTYAPFQLQADEILTGKGWTRNVDFVSKVYEGTTHHESDWRNRLPDVFRFLVEQKTPE
jgi:predicted alpha/beta superfamily hydrolase